MKTSVSIPEDVLKEADRIARRLRMNRSELYATALREFIRREELRQEVDKLCASNELSVPDNLKRAATESLKHSEW